MEPAQNLAKTLTALAPEDLRARVAANAARIAQLGSWPARIDARDSLADRIPADGETAAGFDAGIACALGLMPPQAEKLAATLHAAYTPAAVTEVRAAITKDTDGRWHIHDADSATCWWLAACSLCTEGDTVDAEMLRTQIHRFAALHGDENARRSAAEKTLNAMCASFETARGYAFGSKDGCMQGAYIAGHDVAVMHAAHHGVYFIGTFHPSLGLENFGWGTATDEKGRAKSGPVHGSRQFVKCADESELTLALKAVRLYGPAAKSPRPAP